MQPERQLPLPERQYRWYVIVFQVLMLGSLLGAMAYILWGPLAPLGWREAVVLGLLAVQIGLFVGVLALAKEWPLSRRRLLLYFGGNLAIWLIEYWLVPDVYWIVFAYIGQMFGLLPARYGLGAALFTSVVILLHGTGWDLSGLNSDLLLGLVAVWATFFFLLYMNHLARTSQERGRLIAELQAAQKELEAAQQRESELAVLRERERLARDLHDSLGHALVALSVQLEAIQRLYRVDPEQASGQVEEMKALTRSSMDALRRSLAGLRAPGLGDRPLRPALQALCVDFGQRTGLEITCGVGEAADGLSPALAEAIWRVAQEALTNVEKHAQARTVRVELRQEPGSVVLRIADDGIGLPAGAESAPNCFGLRGMCERVEGLGGRLRLDGGQPGTVVEASLPVIAAAGPAAA
jgi:signal transduction histidine kinase